MLITLLSVLFFNNLSLLTIILSLFACYHIDPEFPADDEVNPQYAQVRISHQTVITSHVFGRVKVNLCANNSLPGGVASQQPSAN